MTIGRDEWTLEDWTYLYRVANLMYSLYTCIKWILWDTKGIHLGPKLKGIL